MSSGKGRKSEALSLRTRLTIGTVGTLAVAICVGLVAAYVVVRGQLVSEIDKSLKDRASALATFTHDAPRPPSTSNFRLPPPKFGAAAGYVQIVGQGQISLPAGESTRLPIDGAAAVASGSRAAYFRDATVSGVHLRIYTARINKATAVEIARPLTEVNGALERIRLYFLIAALAALAGAAAVGTAVARGALRPVKRLTEHAERIARTGNLAERTNERRSDELGRLAHAFNTMLDALSRSVSAQRQLVGDASHELRTPLAAARANLELVQLHEQLPLEERRRLLADAEVELREMTDLIEGLVELARVDAATPDRQLVRFDHLVEEVVAAAERRSDLSFQTILEPTTVNAAPGPLTRAIANLVDNAVKWNAESKPVEVTVRDGTVTVRDHGPGIDPADLPHIFDRFYRAPAARTLPGSGLGLAIVRQVAEAYGGAVTAELASDGGALFTLSLPALDEAANEKERENQQAVAGRAVSSQSREQRVRSWST
jgi:two-component system, OmpR family, sensor histidine kinase MprB